MTLSDLRFTSKEAATLLSLRGELVLSSEKVATLQEWTEGWAAGLFLAALSLKNADETIEQNVPFTTDI